MLRPAASDSRLDPRLAPPLLDTAGSVGAGRRTAHQPQLPLPVDTPPPQAVNTASQVRLSGPGQLISQLLQPHLDKQLAIRPLISLLGSMQEPRSSTQIAERLGQSIKTSGLFYESHLNKWFQGKLPVAELAAEPQMRFQPGRAPADAGARLMTRDNPFQPGSPQLGGLPKDNITSSPAAPLAGARGPAPDAAVSAAKDSNAIADTALRGRAAQGATADLSPRWLTDQTEGGDNSSHQPLAREHREQLHALVRHQLELLNSPNLKWHGELCPDMSLFVEIRMPTCAEDGPQDSALSQSDRVPEPDTWESTIELALPALGAVVITLRKTPANLAIDIVAARRDTATLLQSKAATVLEGLGQRGVTDSCLNISADFPAEPAPYE